MKLRNKKTGQLGNFIINKDHFECVDLDCVPEYRNLAELNTEWEDYEDPKDYYLINLWGEVSVEGGKYQRPGLSELGLTFGTREEAEKAIEKLKAWKRLKDKGFRCSGFSYTELCDYARINIQATMINDGINDDLDLLFGGEE